MVSDVGKAMARLRHRDVRTRRRAVRTLFENDDPTALEAFEYLLDDEDSWFVSKALEAYRRWCPSSGIDTLTPLLNHSSVHIRRTGANLLGQFGADAEQMALLALTDKDHVVQKKAAGSLLQSPTIDAASAMLAHSNEHVRALGITHPACPQEAILRCLSDASMPVREAALSAAIATGCELSFDDVEPFLWEGEQQADILSWLVTNDTKRFTLLAPQLTSQHVRALTTHLRRHVRDSSHPLIRALLESNMLVPVARWVVQQGRHEDDLRWELVSDARLDTIERSKVLERLIGRAGEQVVQDEVQRLLSQPLEELLKVACENLSTAAGELAP